jgi:hypothetical protein
MTDKEPLEFFGFWVDFCKRDPMDQFNDPYVWNEKDDEALANLQARLSEPPDHKFIRHIQAHLKPGEEVICKICGKTVKEIDNEIS